MEEGSKVQPTTRPSVYEIQPFVSGTWPKEQRNDGIFGCKDEDRRELGESHEA